MPDPKPNALYSPLLTRHGFRHAFFTRRGGFSKGPYASLNFSFSVGDDASDVDRNLRAAAHSLDLSVSRLYFLSQVHGNHCVELTAEADQRSVVFTEGDALVSGETNVGCGVRTADCIPVLIADPVTGRVGAAHAGWRGLVAGVLEQTVQRVAASDIRRLVAAVGPHIETTAFEVSEDVATELRSASPGVDPVVRDFEKPHVNLRRVAEAQLLSLGLQPENVDHVSGCTFTDSARFFSFRRDGKASGRHLSVIVAR